VASCSPLRLASYRAVASCWAFRGGRASSGSDGRSARDALPQATVALAARPGAGGVLGLLDLDDDVLEADEVLLVLSSFDWACRFLSL